MPRLHTRARSQRAAGADGGRGGRRWGRGLCSCLGAASRWRLGRLLSRGSEAAAAALALSLSLSRLPLQVESKPAKMDIYDTQTLGVVVFGGFMVVSAIGIFLVSTFSMKETSYEEALANQRKEMAKTHHQKGEKKKKEKTVEKKGKTKKKEEKPNGKIPEHDLDPNVTIILKEPVRVPAVAVAPTSVHSSVGRTPVATVPAMPQEKLASSPKDKKKKEKKVAKVEPAVSSIVNSIQVLASKSAILEASPKEVPMVAVPPVGSKASAPATSSQGKKGQGAQNQAKKGEGAQNQAKKGEGAQNQAKKGDGAQNQVKKGGRPESN